MLAGRLMAWHLSLKQTSKILIVGSSPAPPAIFSQKLPMRTTKWKREDLVEAVAKSFSVTETMRNLELAPTGSNSTVNKYIKLWGIDTSHFLSQSDRVKGIHKQSIPLSDVLVDDSPYSRKDLKKNDCMQLD